MYLEQVHRLFQQSLLSATSLKQRGRHAEWRDGKARLTRMEWDVSGNCQNPIARELYARKSQDRDHVALTNLATGKVSYSGPATMPHLILNITARCRQCEACLARRAWLWKERGKHELQESVRTWFCTLTIAPQSRYRMALLAERDFNRRGKDPKGGFNDLGRSEQFRLVHGQISKEITKYLKRVRKISGSKLRYLIVAEAHKDGYPHYHMLVHERIDQKGTYKPVRKKVLKGQWKLGRITDFSLCWDNTNPYFVNDAKSALYICKYLSKSMMARVRASIGYGRGEPGNGRGPRSSPSPMIAQRVSPAPLKGGKGTEGAASTEFPLESGISPPSARSADGTPKRTDLCRAIPSHTVPVREDIQRAADQPGAFKIRVYRLLARVRSGSPPTILGVDRASPQCRRYPNGFHHWRALRVGRRLEWRSG